MTSFQRLHEEPSIPSFLEGYEQDRWRLTNSQAFTALAYKSCLPSLILEKPAPSLLLLTTNSAHLARMLAARLHLDVGFTECLLFARFLGYPAGGEFSARILSRLMQKFGGFSLGAHSLRIIDELEMIFPEFNGLNASWEIRHALGAVPSQFMRTYRETAPDKTEHGVAAFATRLALLQIDLLHFPREPRDNALRHCALWNQIQSAISASYPQLETKRLFTFTLHQFLLRLIEEAALVTGQIPVTLSPNSDRSLQDLEHSLHRERKQIIADSASSLELEKAFTTAFHLLQSRQQLIPEKYALRIKKDGVPRVICDYLVSLSNVQLLALGHQPSPVLPTAPGKAQMDLL